MRHEKSGAGVKKKKNLRGESEEPGDVKRLTGLAVINVGFTVASNEARPAVAAVTAQSVLTGRAIDTGILHTLFDVHLTRLA